MKLYIAAGVYVGTQAEAKKLDRDFTPVEVPTDKEGLIAYLNDNFPEDPKVCEIPSVGEDDISDLLGDDAPALVPPPTATAFHLPVPRVSTTQDVIDWMLDVATPHQIEGLFAALGARFHEAVKDKAND